MLLPGGRSSDFSPPFRRLPAQNEQWQGMPGVRELQLRVQFRNEQAFTGFPFVPSNESLTETTCTAKVYNL